MWRRLDDAKEAMAADPIVFKFGVVRIGEGGGLRRIERNSGPCRQDRHNISPSKRSEQARSPTPLFSRKVPGMAYSVCVSRGEVRR